MPLAEAFGFNKTPKEGTMYDIVGEFEKKGIEIGKQKADAEALGIMSQCLIAHLEQRFPNFPDNLKDRIKNMTDLKKLATFIFNAGAAHSLDEIARQLAV